jgi:hypothetical protein
MSDKPRGYVRQAERLRRAGRFITFAIEQAIFALSLVWPNRVNAEAESGALTTAQRLAPLGSRPGRPRKRGSAPRFRKADSIELAECLASRRALLLEL